MIKLFLIFALFFQSNGETTVQKLQNKFESIENLQADFSQSSNGKSSLKGKFYFSKENNYRIELSNNTIISDGSSIWNHDVTRKKVIVSNIDEDPLAFSLYEYIFDYPEKCEVTEEQDGNDFLLILNGEKTDLQFKTAKLWVNSDYLISKIRVIDFSGNAFTLVFKNIKIDKNLSNSLFKYIDDKNINKLIDLR